jgi:hypothetical protein
MRYEFLVKHNFFAKVRYYSTKSELFILRIVLDLKLEF